MRRISRTRPLTPGTGCLGRRSTAGRARIQNTPRHQRPASNSTSEFPESTAESELSKLPDSVARVHNLTKVSQSPLRLLSPEGTPPEVTHQPSLCLLSIPHFGVPRATACRRRKLWLALATAAGSAFMKEMSLSFEVDAKLRKRICVPSGDQRGR